MTQLNSVAELSVDELPSGRGVCVTDEVEVIEMTDVRSEGLKVANSDRKEGQGLE